MPTYDDDPVTGEPWKMTIWEFWITPCPYNWRPMPNATGPSFTAWIEPEVDHLGQSMGRFIAFELFPSTEPGECLNSHFLCPYDVDGVFDGIELHGIHDNDADLQFPPYLEGMYVYGQWEEDEEGPYVHNFTFAVTQQPTTIATVGTIFCFDGGAYGVLLAYTNMPEGIVFARRTDTGLIEPVEIPYDKNGNFIADVWEWNMGIYPADALGDFDNYPVGDGTPGDGLSIYEEYRGLMVRYLWTVFNPWIKDMFVMNFGAGNENPYQPAVIPNDAITDAKGFPGAGMPLLWLLNANEGSGYPFRVVNFLWGYAHRRDVYAAIVVPGNVDDVYDKAYGVTYGPIWGNPTAPIIEIDLENIDEGLGSPCNDCNQPANRGTCWLCFGRQQPFQHCGHCQTFLYCCDCDNDHPNDEQQCGECGYNIHNLSQHQVLTWVVGHELGHTVLWHQPDRGHHSGATTYDCLIWEYGDWRVNPPTEFCVQNPGCQTRWKLNP
jgi:hypothetical protein